MPKKTGIAIVAVGAVLILSALLLLLYNRYEDAHAGQEAESLLASVEAAISAQATDTPAATAPKRPDTTETPAPTPLDPEMPVVLLDGYEYVGYVEIPVLGLKLPVMSEWDYNRLKLAPCRQFGSSRTDDLVIAAHNYKTHFRKIRTLSEGSEVRFTDAAGNVFVYHVAVVEALTAQSVEEMISGGWPLSLFTCTADGKNRVTVRCE